MALSKNIELSLIGLGAALLVVFILLRMYGVAGALLGRASLEVARAGPTMPRASTVSDTIDFRLWSEKRIKAFRESIVKRFQPPLALLSIPRIGLEVPVFNGTNEEVLNRGVGRIIGTAHMGERGNLGIAGHRDGFFRALKDVQSGDAVELIAATRKFVYQVDNIAIVAPEDVHILDDRAVPTITLVTCYPFYFVGDAPQRYVLQCSLKENNQLTGGSQTRAARPSSAAQRKEDKK
jgi:sortase A